MKCLIKILSLVAVVAFFATSCGDSCADVVCGSNSACEEGVCVCFPTYIADTTGGTGCVCPAGYEAAAMGDSCNIEWSAKFIGTNMAAQDTIWGDNGNFTAAYNTTFSRVDEKTLTTTNFGGFGATNVVDMDVTDSYSLSINHTDVGGRVWTGTGSIAGTTMVIDYVVLYGDGTRDTCQSVITQ